MCCAAPHHGCVFIHPATCMWLAFTRAGNRQWGAGWWGTGEALKKVCVYRLRRLGFS
jgi:hypothetical protein